MKTALKVLSNARNGKSEREKRVLLGIVDLFIQSYKPIGSNTLKENGFSDLSSATIRNYFSKLEKEGYLTQQHSSGGRIPTSKGFQYYAKHFLSEEKIKKETEKSLKEFLEKETPQIHNYIQKAAEFLSEMLFAPITISEPSLEMDFIQKVKFFALDKEKIAAILFTGYGITHTETLYSPQSFEEKDLTYLENYFYWRLSKQEKPFEEGSLLKWAQRLYNELVLRHLIDRSTPSFYSTGISKLLHYSECNDASYLAQALSLFENTSSLEKLLQKSLQEKKLTCLIGEQLSSFLPGCFDFCVISIPYKIGPTFLGSITLFAPMRVSYKSVFPIMRRFSELLSENLTKNVYKYQIPFSQEERAYPFRPYSPSILLEDKGTP